jgi:hypothetical protein
VNSTECDSKTLTDEQLLNSPMLQKLAALSLVVPINTNNHNEVEAALAPSFVFLIDALDNDTIQFQNNADKQAFLQIMLVCHQVISQMRPTSSTFH